MVPLLYNIKRKKNVQFLIAAFTFARISGGIGSILWAVFACSTILTISAASVGAEVVNVQFFPKHAKDGIFFTNVKLVCAYLCLFIFGIG